MKEIVYKLYNFWTVVVCALIGGILVIFEISEGISRNISLILVDSPNGTLIPNPENPKIINIYIVFSILFIILILFFALISTIHDRRKASPELNELRSAYNQIVLFSRNIVHNFYDESRDVRRVDPIEIEIFMTIEPDETANVWRKYTLLCPEKPAHLFRNVIEADDDSPGIIGHKRLSFRAKDVERDREMDWIPIDDSLRRKEFAIFFPEMQPGETKTVEIQYIWPRYVKQLLEKGFTEFWWSHKPASRGATAKATYTWLFKKGFPQVRAKLRGNISQTANLDFNQDRDGVWFKYYDPSEALGSISCRVLFELPMEGA